MSECKICNQTNSRFLLTKNGYSIKQCQSCGTCFIDKRIKSEKLAEIYSEQYYQGKPTQNWINRLAQIKKYKKQGNLLDFGCGVGDFLKKASKDFKAIGLEISKSACAEATRKNLLVFNVSLKNLKPKQPFDVITMWDSIEHLKNPKSTLRQIKNLLKPGGLLAISTVNIKSLFFNIFKENWRYLIPPEHLFYFSPKSITKLLENLGFEILNFKTNTTVAATEQSLKSVNLGPNSSQYQILKKYFRPLKKALFWLIMEKMKKGDIIEVYALKQP